MNEDQATGEMAGRRRLEAGVDAFLLEPGQVGELALGHEFFGELGGEAVQADDDDLVDQAVLEGLLAPDQAEEKPERPGQEGKNGQEKSQKQDEKRGKEGESRAGADIGAKGASPRQAEARTPTVRPSRDGESGSSHQYRSMMILERSEICQVVPEVVLGQEERVVPGVHALEAGRPAEDFLFLDRAFQVEPRLAEDDEVGAFGDERSGVDIFGLEDLAHDFCPLNSSFSSFRMISSLMPLASPALTDPLGIPVLVIEVDPVGVEGEGDGLGERSSSPSGVEFAYLRNFSFSSQALR